MSQYDRRTWQRPKGERTADPLWQQDIAQITSRQPKTATVNTTDKAHKSSIAGNCKGRGLRRLLMPQYDMQEG